MATAAVREATLTELLAAHPSAPIAAIGGDGRFVEVPATLELRGQQVVRARSALELVTSNHRPRIIEAWDEVKEVGVSKTRVQLVNGIDATYHFVDVRHRHGVLVGLIVTDAAIELLASLDDRPPVTPKFGSTEKDEQAIIRSADDRICRILGYERDELVGMRSLELIHPDDRDRAIDIWLEMLGAPGGVTRVRLRHLRKDGTWLWLELTNTNLLEAAEGRVVTEMIDVAEEMAALEALRQREELLRRLAEALPTGVLHVDGQRNVVYGNAPLHALVGIGPMPTAAEQLCHVVPADAAAIHAALGRILVDGKPFSLEARVAVPGTEGTHRCAINGRVLTDATGAPDGAILCFDDVTEASMLRDELQRRATTDALTGCLNRAAVLDHLVQQLAGQGDGPGTAVVFLDLDGFKVVNDTFGHEAGDHLLARAASRLRAAMRSGDVVGRLGGDEFIAVLRDVPDPDAAMLIADRVVLALTEPLELVAEIPMRIRASVGVAWSSAAGVDADTLTAAADRAMYVSKRAGDGAAVLATV